MAPRGIHLKGSAHRYGRIAILFHWTAAAAILALIVLGFLCASPAVPNHKILVLRAHVVIGLAVFALTLTRAILRGWVSVARVSPLASPLASLNLVSQRLYVHAIFEFR